MVEADTPFATGTVPIPDVDTYHELFVLTTDGPRLVCKLCGGVLIGPDDWPAWEDRRRAGIDAVASHGVDTHGFPADGTEWTIDLLQREGWYTTVAAEEVTQTDG